MRTILRAIAVIAVLVAFIGLLGASVTPLTSKDDSDDDDGPSFYARARKVHAVRPAPLSALEAQIVLMKRNHG